MTTNAIREDVRDARRAEFAMKSISIYSPSGGESELATLIHSELSNTGLRPRIDGAGNVICEIGSGDFSILLCGHMDTVPGVLPLKFEDGMILGRGACDAKGALLSLLFAFEDLAADNPRVRLVFAAVTGEELMSEGLAELMKNNIRTDYAIFGEPGGVSKITIGYRGHVTIRLEVITPEVHASAPKLTTNSIELLFEIYNSIKNAIDASDNSSTEHVSASMTQISGGTTHNVIPGRTTGVIDVRTPAGFSNQQVREEVSALISNCAKSHPGATINVRWSDSTDPYRVRLDSPLVRAMSRSILRTGVKPTMIMKSGTGDMNTYALAYGIEALTYGPGDAKLSHTSDERVSIKEILACCTVIVNATKELVAIRGKGKSG